MDVKRPLAFSQVIFKHEKASLHLEVPPFTKSKKKKKITKFIPGSSLCAEVWSYQLGCKKDVKKIQRPSLQALALCQISLQAIMGLSISRLIFQGMLAE